MVTASCDSRRIMRTNLSKRSAGGVSQKSSFGRTAKMDGGPGQGMGEGARGGREWAEIKAEGRSADLKEGERDRKNQKALNQEK